MDIIEMSEITVDMSFKSVIITLGKSPSKPWTYTLGCSIRRESLWMLMPKHISIGVIKLRGSINCIKNVYYSTISVDIKG